MSDPTGNYSQNDHRAALPDPVNAQGQAETLATISLILGVVGLFSCGITAMIGLVLVIIARYKGASGTIATVSLVVNIVISCLGLLIGGSVLFIAVEAYVEAAAGASAGILLFR
ncbi:MAG: hypothetical protein JW817_08415 [Clostridiales bacterium]|nr:hypothetical protein [Clostridiales bacterium]